MKPKPIKISVKKLKKLNACIESIVEFEMEYGAKSVDVFKVIKKLEERKDDNGYTEWLFENLKLTGRCQAWHPNGQKEYDHNYQNGQLHGRCQSWYPNGQKEHDLNYQNGQRHGHCQDWYPNGQREYNCNYENGNII